MRLFLESTWRPDLQRAEILDAGLDTLLACDASGAIAGFAQLRVAHPPAGIAVHAPVELKRFYVDKPWHGQGLARTLMQAAEQAARARGARELWLGVWERNERAQAFYRKCGFRKVGHADLRRRHGSADRSRDASRARMNVRIEHVGVWVGDIDRVAAFYAKYFGAQRGRRSIESAQGIRIALPQVRWRRAPRSHDAPGRDRARGRPSSSALRTWRSPSATKRPSMRWPRACVADGVTPDSGPRRTGDGYYECVVRDPEGNRVEIAAGDEGMKSLCWSVLLCVFAPLARGAGAGIGLAGR